MPLYSLTKRESGIISKGFYFLVANILAAFCIYYIRLIFKNHLMDIYVLFPEYQNQLFNDDIKLKYLLKIASFYGIYMLVCIFGILAARLITRSPPRIKEDTMAVKIMLRITQNSVETGMIFFLTFSYFIFYHSMNVSKEIILMLGALFILGRIFFFFGYLFAFIYLPQMRTAGVALSFTSILIPILYCYGVDFPKYLVEVQFDQFQ